MKIHRTTEKELEHKKCYCHSRAKWKRRARKRWYYYCSVHIKRYVKNG